MYGIHLALVTLLPSLSAALSCFLACRSQIPGTTEWSGTQVLLGTERLTGRGAQPCTAHSLMLSNSAIVHVLLGMGAVATANSRLACSC